MSIKIPAKTVQRNLIGQFSFSFLFSIQILDVKNVVVVVTRWFGGILLGGDRFKHINNAARDALELGGYVSATKASAGSDDSGAKGKKTKKK